VSLGAVVVLGAVLVCSGLMLWIALRILPRRQADQQLSLLKVFGSAVELRCPGREGLTDRVATLCIAIGKDMGLPKRDLRQLEHAARLRDIGLCAIPWKLINERDSNDWTPAERATFAKHTEVSAAMLELVPTLRGLAPIIRQHHGALNQEMPIASRIIAVAEAYVERTSQQGHLVARTYLGEEKGCTFDPSVVEACLRVLPSDRGPVR